MADPTTIRALLAARLAETATVAVRDFPGAGSERGFSAYVCDTCAEGVRVRDVLAGGPEKIQHARHCPLHPDRVIGVRAADLRVLLALSAPLPPGELLRIAQEARAGRLKVAGPWRRWQPEGRSGWYRPDRAGGTVAVRTGFDDERPVPWSLGRANDWSGEGADLGTAMALADTALRAAGWLICDEEVSGG